MSEHLAHAEHLKTLLRQAREKVEAGRQITSEDWDLMESVAKKMEEAIPR